MRILTLGVIFMWNVRMKLRPIHDDMVDLRLDPQHRLCNKFDALSIAMFRVADRGEMGIRVLDNCAEEHIM